MIAPPQPDRATARRQLDAVLREPDPTEGLWDLLDGRRLDDAVPELAQLAMQQDPVHRHKDILSHTVAVTAKTPPQPTIRMAALLHDIGKPATRRFGPDGVTFRHHEAVGARIARNRLAELGYDDAFVTDVARLIELSGRFHGYQHGWTDAAVRRYARDAGHLLGDLSVLVRCDCTTRDDRKVAASQARMDDLETRLRALAGAAREAQRRPALNGDEVMAVLGVDPAPVVGRALAALRAHERRHGPSPEPAELVRRWFDEGSLGA